MKHYYRVISFYGSTGYADNIWHCSHDTASKFKCDVIIPLDRKPRNTPILEGK